MSIRFKDFKQEHLPEHFDCLYLHIHFRVGHQTEMKYNFILHVCTHSKWARHALQRLQDASGCGAGYPAGLSTSRLGLDLSPHRGLHIR